MSAWVPRLGLLTLIIGVGYAIYSIAVGEGGPQADVELEGRPAVQDRIAGLRQLGARLGDADAPVRIDLFTDLRAVEAAEFQEDVVDPVIAEYVRPGRAQIYLRHFSFGRTSVTEPAIAADAAGEQGHQWQYAEIVLANLGNAPPRGLDEEFLRELAEVTPGLEVEEWREVFDAELERQRQDPDYESAVDEDGEAAFELELPAQPALLISGPGGEERLVDTPSLDEARAAIERVEVQPE